ncbi:MAG: hypothetical protein KF824_03480 [Fimbriimonadaceae bacterium]|nr:MAG: hypothetical protein KF824_03480 [Fimbriimonadaceae bacterium]
MAGKSLAKNKHINEGKSVGNDLVEGNVALVDILGFKGIWQRHSPASVLETIDSLRRSLDTLVQQNDKPFVYHLPLINEDEKQNITHKRDEKGRVRLTRIEDRTAHFQYAIISDTIMLSYVGSSENDINGRLKLGVLINEIQNALLRSSPRLLLRGCITAGKYALRDSTILGPAIDDSAQLYEQSEAAVVWVNPNTRFYCHSGPYDKEQWRYQNYSPIAKENADLANLIDGRLLPDIPIKLKGGLVISAHVVCPFWGSFDSHYKQLYKAFQSKTITTSIAAKVHATLEHTRICEQRLKDITGNPNISSLTKYRKGRNYDILSFWDKEIKEDRAVVSRVLSRGAFCNEEVWLDK